MNWVYALGLGYLLGSVPFGLILTRMFDAGDIRQIGSGNIGATNVLRTGRKGLAAGTLLLDGAKGFLAVWLAWRWFPEVAGLAALGAVLGHCFPLWLKFKGGKGVATTLGVTLGLAWPIGAAYAAAWLLMLAVTRISSLSGMVAAMVRNTVARSKFTGSAAVSAMILLGWGRPVDRTASLQSRTRSTRASRAASTRRK